MVRNEAEVLFFHDTAMIFNFDLQVWVFHGFNDKIATYLWMINVVFFFLL